MQNEAVHQGTEIQVSGNQLYIEPVEESPEEVLPALEEITESIGQLADLSESSNHGMEVIINTVYKFEFAKILLLVIIAGALIGQLIFDQFSR